jgi:isopentenyl-diphosphate delta-isomerase
MSVNHVILVDEEDREIGFMDKLQAHLIGRLHRAFSVFIFNDNNELLLQRRALDKYHSKGLWTNTCCSHPSPGEVTQVAAEKRLVEEMGLYTTLEPSFHLLYKANVCDGLIEYEYDHVFMGRSNENPVLNPQEAMDFKWASLESIQEEIRKNPENYSEWFKIIVSNYLDEISDFINHESLQARNV